MEEDGEDLTPFWVKSTNNRSHTDRIRSVFSSFFFSSGLLIILLLVTAVFFLVFIVPSTISFSTQIFRPNSIKKSWDSLNVVLVIFALVFGFLSRATTTNQNSTTRNGDDYQSSSPISSRNEIQRSNPSTPQRKWYNYTIDEEQTSSPISSRNENQISNPSTPQRKWYHYSMNEDQRKYLLAFQQQQQWFGYSDQTASYNQVNISRGGLRRATSSYPDLLEASSQFISGDDSLRFYDDMTVDTHRTSDTGQFLRRRSWKDKFEVPKVAENKNISVDTFVNPPREDSSPSSPPPPPLPVTSLPSPPPQSSIPMPKAERPKLAHRSRERRRKRKEKDNEMENRELISSTPVAPPPPPTSPPPPSPPPLPEFVDQKISKTKDFLNSLYHNKNKKKQRQKSIESFDFSLLYQSQIPQLPQQAPSPPQPPPTVFQNLFSSKKFKRKKPDPNLSAPKLSQPETLIPTPEINSKPSIPQITTKSTKQPVKVRSFDSVEETSNSGGESPLIPIPPPPPPPPPFAKSLTWKFVVQGDYVRVDSNLSSRSSSPDIDDVESSDGMTPTATDGGDATAFPPSPLFFPSPDVNTKAENFITNFRAGLKIEKVNSINKRGLGLSNLGRGSGPNQL